MGLSGLRPSPTCFIKSRNALVYQNNLPIVNYSYIYKLNVTLLMFIFVKITLLFGLYLVVKLFLFIYYVLIFN